MKKFVGILLLVLALLTIVAPVAYAGDINVVVNGKTVNFPDTRPYISQENRTMVPVRFISEQLGARVNWNGSSNSVDIQYGSKTISLPINQKLVYVDDKQLELDAPAVIKDNRTMVPLRFISEALDARVLWSSAVSTVRVSSGNYDGLVAKNNGKYKAAPKMAIDLKKQYAANVTTNRGTFKIKLLASNAPQTVNNFVFLAREGFYNGTRFHRIIKGFMIQGGDPLGNGTGGPGYSFADELPPSLSYAPGVVAMANSRSNTNGSQFFICNGNAAASLNKTPNYSVFGQVIEGMEVVNIISDTPVSTNAMGEYSQPMEEVYIEKIQIEEK